MLNYGHSEIINSVRWVSTSLNGSRQKYLVSCSVDKKCIIWARKNDRFEAEFILKGAEDSCIVADSLVTFDGVQNDQFMTVASSNDQVLRLWLDDSLEIEEHVNSFVFDVKIRQNLLIPGTIVFYAGSDDKVHVSRFTLSSDRLEKLVTIKGHQDWVRSIDVHQNDDQRLYIASASQDTFIRVYIVEKSNQTQDNEQDPMAKLHQQTFVDKSLNNSFIVNLETVLAGHEAWVTSVKWHWCQNSSRLNLLSSSMDKTVILWELVSSNGESIWNEQVRLGELGGNAIGFLGCSLSISGKMIISYTFNGAINVWQHDSSSQEWLQQVPITGHFGDVTDLVWEPQGQYFLTCSSDQTTRLHGKWNRSNNGSHSLSTWHELARPQVHGYDLKCLAMAGRLKLISGADEKVVRVFCATKGFIESLHAISGTIIDSDDRNGIADGASLPALGLSNSAVYGSDKVGSSTVFT